MNEEDNDDEYELESEYPHPDAMLTHVEMKCWEKFDFNSLPDATLDDIADSMQLANTRLVTFATFKGNNWLLGNFWFRDSQLDFFSEWKVNPQTKTVTYDEDYFRFLTIQSLFMRQDKFKKLPEQCPGNIPTLEQLAYANTTRAQRDFLRSDKNTIHRPHNLPGLLGGKQTRNKRKTNKRKTNKKKTNKRKTNKK